MSALHTSVDVGLLSNQTAFIHFHAGRFSRHSAFSNIIRRSLDSADLDSILEPVGLDPDDGRRPDGVTYFPFKGSKSLAWDSTCTDSFTTSNLYSNILYPVQRHARPRT